MNGPLLSLTIHTVRRPQKFDASSKNNHDTGEGGNLSVSAFIVLSFLYLQNLKSPQNCQGNHNNKICCSAVCLNFRYRLYFVLVVNSTADWSTTRQTAAEIGVYKKRAKFKRCFFTSLIQPPLRLKTYI